MQQEARSSGSVKIIGLLVVVAVVVAAWLFVVSPMLQSSSDPHWNVQTTVDGDYKVTVTPSIDPIEINRTHGWTVHIEDKDGNPTENAEISISGHMPAHGHGFPTAPEVTEYLGNGSYKIEGMEFQMPGDWVVEIVFMIGDVRETVQYTLSLDT